MEATHFEALYPAETRQEEIDKLISFVKEGNSVQLVGLPGSGRSVVMGLLTFNRQLKDLHLKKNAKWFQFVLHDFSEIKNRNLFDATKFLFLNLVNSLQNRNMQEEYEKVNSLLKESLSYKDELILFQGLKSAIDYLSLEKELTVVFLFERFEQYLPMLTSEFFTNLRTLRNHAKYRFSAVFSLNRPLEEMLEPSMLGDFYEFVADHEVYLSLYNKPGIDFRISYLEKASGKQLTDNQKQQLLKLTGGHGKLMRIGTEILLHEQTHDMPKLLLTHKPIRSALLEIWYSLNPGEQKHLTLLVNGEKPEDTHPYLDKSGLLVDNKIQIPLFTEFIKAEFSEPIQTHIEYNPNTNMIVEGNRYISERLTSSEYRLLRYLLEHPDTVIERDNIIDAVWSDNKTTEGVSNQALDQLIFRLRKKIEENVNEPKHLLTVKGRGFRFIP